MSLLLRAEQGGRKEEKTKPPRAFCFYYFFSFFSPILEKPRVPRPLTLNIHPHIQSQKHFTPFLLLFSSFFPLFLYFFFAVLFFFSSPPSFLSAKLSHCCSLSLFSLFIFFIFIRLFWNQILTWRSVRFSTRATSYLRSRVRYILNKNSFSSSRVWYFV